MTRLSLTLRDPIIRASALALFFMGVGASMAFPLLTLFFVQELGLRPSVASLFFLTSLGGPLISIVTGRVSDRLRSRYPLILITVGWVALGWFLLSLAQHFWLVLLIGVVFFGFIGTVNAQVFAQLRDYLTAKAVSHQNQIVASVRTAYAAGWIVGPIVGNWIGLAIGLRELLVITAALYLGSQLPLLALRSLRKSESEPGAEQATKRASATLIYVFAGLCAFAMSGDTIKISFLPIYMREQLGAPAWLQGAVISTQPVLELLLIPLMGVLADKFGATRLLVIGACAGVLGHTLFALGQHIAVLFAGQVLVSLLVASILGLGMTVAQDLYPSGVGYASSIFFGGLSLSAALGGLLGGIGVSQLGMPLVFLIPVLVSGFVGFGFYFIRAKQPVEGRLSETYDSAVDSG